MSEERNNNFQIGQVIYLLSEKSEKIVPAIVIEEVLVKKLDGKFVSWKVAVGPPNRRKEIDSNKLKGEVYASLDEIRDVMTRRLSVFIDNLVGEAKKRTDVWYGKHMIEHASPSGLGGKIDPAVLIDNFDDGMGGTPTQPGTLAGQSLRIPASAPSGPLRPNVDISSDPAAAGLRQKYPAALVNLATPSDEEMNDVSSSSDFMVDEQGNRIPIKYTVNE